MYKYGGVRHGGGVGRGGQRSNARMRTGDPISSGPAKAWSGSAESVGAQVPDSPCAMPWSVTANACAADEVQAARGATASSAAAGIRSHGATSCDKMSGKRQLQQKTHRPPHAPHSMPKILAKTHTCNVGTSLAPIPRPSVGPCWNTSKSSTKAVVLSLWCG